MSKSVKRVAKQATKNTPKVAKLDPAQRIVVLPAGKANPRRAGSAPHKRYSVLLEIAPGSGAMSGLATQVARHHRARHQGAAHPRCVKECSANVPPNTRDVTVHYRTTTRHKGNLARISKFGSPPYPSEIRIAPLHASAETGPVNGGPFARDNTRLEPRSGTSTVPITNSVQPFGESKCSDDTKLNALLPRKIRRLESLGVDDLVTTEAESSVAAKVAELLAQHGLEEAQLKSRKTRTQIRKPRRLCEQPGTPARHDACWWCRICRVYMVIAADPHWQRQASGSLIRQATQRSSWIKEMAAYLIKTTIRVGNEYGRNNPGSNVTDFKRGLFRTAELNA